MLARNKIIFCLFCFFIFLIIIDSVQNVARSYSDVFLTNYNCTNSPLDGKSCAFTGCHTGAAPITIPGLITSNIPPAGYTPGVTYSLTASLNRPGHTHFGFSISPQNGAQILGTLVVTDANRTYASYPGGGYITHKRNGVANTNSASWSFDWIAPAAGSGTVIFYGSLLACESSGAVYTSLGDTTFLSTLTIAENVCNVPGPAGSISGATTICGGSTNTYFINPVSGATSYVWSLPPGWTGNSTTNSINATSNSTIGEISVYASNACGDGLFSTLFINVDPAMGPTINPTHVTCFGGNDGSAAGFPNGGTSPYTYSWLPQGGSNAIANSLTSGNYTVTISDAIGCTASATVSITQPTEIIINTSSTAATCGLANGTATATPSGGAPPYQYEWSPGGALTQTATGLSSGTYTVIVTDNIGCTNTASETITQPSSLSVQVQTINQITCFGNNNGSIQLTTTGGTTPYTFSWVPNVSTTENASALSPGDYTVTVTDNSGCSFVDVYSISEPDILNSSITVLDAACQGQATGGLFVTASGGTLPYSFDWNTNPVQTDDTASNLAAGTYTVIITDAHNCTSTSSGIVQAPPAMIVQSSVDSVDCNGSTLGSAASIQVSGGTPGYTYLWSNNNTTNQISNVLAGTYTVTITDVNGCTVQEFIAIHEPGQLSINASQTNVSCYGESNGSVVLNVTGGTPAYTYSWQSDTSVHSNTLSGLGAGNYLVVVNDIHSCFDTKLISITQPPQLIANPGLAASYCTSGSVVLGGNPSGYGGIPPYIFSWSPVNFLDDPNVPNPTASPDSTEVYTLTVTDSNQCTASAPTQVSVFYTSALFITEGPNVLWTLPGFVSYNWYFNGILDTAISGSSYPNPLDGNYTVEVLDTNGCTTTSTLYHFLTGMNKGISGKTFLMYPNPAQNAINIELSEEYLDGYLYLHNSIGELQIQKKIGNSKFVLEISNLQEGLYFLVIEKEKSILTKRFSILR